MIRWLKNLFIPHEGNDQHPHFWRDKSVAALLAVILLVELGTLAQSYLLFGKNSFLAAVLPGVIVALTNDQRVDNNASPLATNELLTEAAQLKANDMATKGYFSHITPEGYTPWYWLDKVGYSYSHAGENLAVNFSDSEDVVNAWMNSPEHRANILKQVYTQIGVAMAQGTYQGKSAIFVVQFFGIPGNVSPVPSVPPALAEATQQATQVQPVAAKVIARAPVVSSSISTVLSTSTASSNSNAANIDSTSTATLRATSSSLATLASTGTPIVAGAEYDAPSAVPLANVSAASPNFITTFLASPRHAGNDVLLLLLGLVIAALFIILLVNGRVHHKRIVYLSVAFILIIVGLNIFNEQLLKGPVSVGQAGNHDTI